MSFEYLIREYGYYAVFGFACIEGEIALLIAGFLANEGLLSLPYVIIYAFIGTLVTEQILFYIGWFYGEKLLRASSWLKSKTEIVFSWLNRYDKIFIFSFRFIYSIRIASPIIIGAAGISPKKFSLLNIPAAAIWSIVIAGSGYLFANIIEVIIQKFAYYQKILLFSIISIAAIIWLVYRFVNKFRKS